MTFGKEKTEETVDYSVDIKALDAGFSIGSSLNYKTENSEGATNPYEEKK